MKRFADSSLDSSEKEEHEVERLINKYTPPSRKTDNKKGPKHDNRRDRIKTEDSDLSVTDSDLSLATIAHNIVAGKSNKSDKSNMMSGAKRLFDRPDPVFDHKTIVDAMEKSMGKQFGHAPEAAMKVVKDYRRGVRAASSAATSYETELIETMSNRTSSYHGVLQQGHPSGLTNTVYESYDKRYFGKKHFESIVTAAKELMEEDWLKYGWTNGAIDAPTRAALDLAIHLADSNLYQSKIDAETYEMLLNRVAGWDHDQFSETIFPGKDGSNRSASDMNKSTVREFLRIASELKNTNPIAALDIIKVVRSIRAAEDQGQQDQGQRAPAQTSQSQQGQSQGDTDEDVDDSVADKLDIEALQKLTKTMLNDDDVMSFADALRDISGHIKKVSSFRTAGVGGADWPSIVEALEGMSDEEGEAFLESMKGTIGEFNEAVADEDIEGIMSGFDDILKGVEEAVKTTKTSSIRVSTAVLARLALYIPDTRSILLPILAAKKKQQKKQSKKKKQSQEEDDKPKGKGKGKGNPFGGKKAPPFGSKKPGKKKKASIAVESDDSEW